MFESIWSPFYWDKRFTGLMNAWFTNGEKCFGGNEFPLSGDVRQWIAAMGVMFGQFGVVNMNLVGSRNPPLENIINSQYSYGSQLGRMLEILEPLVERQAAVLVRTGKQKELQDFREMARDVKRLKQTYSGWVGR